MLGACQTLAKSAVREDREPSVNIEEGRKPLAIIAGFYESARIGKAVRIEQ